MLINKLYTIADIQDTATRLTTKRLEIKFNQATKAFFAIPAALLGYKVGQCFANFLARATQQYSRTYISKCRDVYLDPHDQLNYIEKGGVYDREAQNLLDALEDGLNGGEEGLQNGTIAVVPPHREAVNWAKNALRFSFVKSYRVGYMTELSTTLAFFSDCIKKAATTEDLEYQELSSGFPVTINSSGESSSNITEVIFQSFLLCEARLADAELRIIRDVLLDTVRYLQDALQLWRNHHDRAVKVLHLQSTCKTLLNVLFRHKNSESANHVLFEVNELPSSKCIMVLELLLQRSVRRVSLLQNHLQGLPNISGHMGGELAGDVIITTSSVCTLERWISDAVALITKTLYEESTVWDTGTCFSRASMESDVEVVKTKAKDLTLPVGLGSFCGMLYPSKTLGLVYYCDWNSNNLDGRYGKGEIRAYGPQEWLLDAIQAVKEEKGEWGGWILPEGGGKMRDGLSLCEKTPQVALLHKSQRSRVESSLQKAGAMHESQKTWLIRKTMVPVFSIGLISMSAKLAYKRREELLHLGCEARQGLKFFWTDQLWVPSRQIASNIFFRSRMRLTDEADLQDAKDSLCTLLDEFIKDVNPEMPENKRKILSKRMDMSAVRREFERNAPSAIWGLLSGKLLRVILIQIQFFKKDLISAMSAIDDLYNANQLNLQAFALVPAFIAGVGLFWGASNIFQVLTTKRVQRTVVVHSCMRGLLRDVERLLTCSKGFTREGYLSLDEIGLLAVYVFNLLRLLEIHSSRFDRRQRKRLEEDLRDFMRADMSVPQLVSVLTRIQASYAFLAPGITAWFLGA